MNLTSFDLQGHGQGYGKGHHRMARKNPKSQVLLFYESTWIIRDILPYFDFWIIQYIPHQITQIAIDHRESEVLTRKRYSELEPWEPLRVYIHYIKFENCWLQQMCSTCIHSRLSFYPCNPLRDGNYYAL